MNIDEIKLKLKSKEYNFLRDHQSLGGNLIILTLGGSYAYGTNNENSDLDIRGCTLNSKMQILTNENFEQYTDITTDTTIYSFNKLITLLESCNPNTIEMLGNKPEHYFYVSPVGQELLDHSSMFLSQRAAHSFGSYAAAQLRRLDNKSARLANQEQKERHILNSIKNACHTFPEKYFSFSEDSVRLYLDQSLQAEFDKEIFMDITLSHYPLRDYAGLWSEMNNIVKDYSKVGKRNKNAIEHNKLGKHMMHLIRLYFMCLDIFESGRIITHREEEHDLLMDIRNGRFLDENRQPIPEFYEMVDEFDKKLDYAKKHTNLPVEPDHNAIREFVADVNERVVKGEI